MITLRAAAGNQYGCTLGIRLGRLVFQLTWLVPTQG